MPGDGDGEPNYGLARTDVTDKWRFYQSPTSHENPPPRNVILDDEAVFRIMHHHLATKKDRGTFWECDFAKSKGSVLVDRQNRGRPAWLDKDGIVEAATIEQRRQLVHSVPVGRTSQSQLPLTGDPKGFTAYLFQGHTQRDRLTATYFMPTPTTRNSATVYKPRNTNTTPPAGDAKRSLRAIHISFDKSEYTAVARENEHQDKRGRKRGASQISDDCESC